MPGNPVCLATAVAAQWKPNEPEEAYSQDEGVQVSYFFLSHLKLESVLWSVKVKLERITLLTVLLCQLYLMIVLALINDS
jgi:hypothetical protein